jgi:hypothetical protein
MMVKRKEKRENGEEGEDNI